MDGRVAHPLARTLARTGGGVLAGLLLVATAAGCTSGSGTPSHASSHGSSSAAAPPPRSAPMRVEVTHVAGRLSARHRAAVTAGVRRALASYVEGAFLGGHYPRTRFDGAFGVFTAGSATAARHDQALLTNRPLGASTSSVRALRRTAYLSVLSPHGKVSGATAAVNLVFAVDRGSEPARTVHLKGRMLLTRDAKGRWAVFGYDLNRSQTATGSAS